MDTPVNMPPPKITVLMPVYNGERFLEEAVESVLQQTYSDFELLVINDGSTDRSVEIISRFQDARIRLLHNERNIGLVATLNRGIGLARGEFIARMDADDICHPERFEAQLQWFGQHPDAVLLATGVVMIDEDGNHAGEWKDDLLNVEPAAIRRFLPRANCIAHPTIMIRTSVARKYLYSRNQDGAEDYDLWLRLAADNLPLHKLPRPLLRYRMNPASVTASYRNLPAEVKQAGTKWRFLRGAMSSFLCNRFAASVAFETVKDLARLAIKSVFRVLVGQWPDDNRDLLALQLNRALLVKLLIRFSAFFGSLIPLVNRSGLFFFFPFFHTGGAERVHADIVNCFRDDKPWVIFTKKSSSRSFYRFFDSGARLLNLWPLCKYGYPFSVGLAAGFINRHSRPCVFGSNSLFYALLLPFLKPHVRCSDLLHAFGGGVETFTLPAVPRLDRRVVINQQTRRDLLEQYEKSALDPALGERIILIPNRIELPCTVSEKPSGDLQVLYVGRGAEEKRVHLVAMAARSCHEAGIPIRFVLAGEVAGWLGQELRQYCELPGNISEPSELSALYSASHIIVITSIREGFPLSLMEGMAHGCVPVCTQVGGIPEHVSHHENGWLLPSGDEGCVLDALQQALKSLEKDRSMLQRLSLAARKYAEKSFSGEQFCEQYQAVIRGSADLD